ncbi:hypothetical protein RIF29_06226 [Crotalaria pallida]|uniref:Uncharacterized protein n=1 Tax=Crotalaria pallida TaxID=3830 RepID=A0AAN9PBE3_CROPI
MNNNTTSTKKMVGLFLLFCGLARQEKKEHYLKSIEDLTKSKALLNQEIDNVKRYNEQLKDFNLRLKARKEELMSEAKKTNLGIGWPMQLVYATVNSTNSMAENQQQYVTLMLNQTCGPHQICNNNNNEGIAQFHYVSGHHPTTSSLPSSSRINSSSSALGMVNNSNNPNSSKNIGPHGNFDLNVTSEELVNVDPCQPLDVNGVNKDLSRVIAAQARQRRIQINRLKNPTGNNSKTRYSYG